MQHKKYVQKTPILIKWPQNIKVEGHFSLFIHVYKIIVLGNMGNMTPISNIFINPCTVEHLRNAVILLLKNSH